MAVTLIATPGSSAANSYMAVADVTSWFEGRASENKWTDLTADQKARHAISATRQIDAVLRNQFTPLLNVTYFNYAQALAWPWPNDGFYHSGTANSGGTTTILDTTLYSAGYPDDYFNGGSVLIYQSTDRKAPESEIKDISDFTRDVDNVTATITMEEMDVAPESGDYYVAIIPPPEWLKDAFCEQVWFVATDNKGIVDKAAQGNVSFSDGKKNFNMARYSAWSGLCHETQAILRAWVPAPRIVRT